VGQIGLCLTIPKLLAWAWRLKRGPIEAYEGLEEARIPMVDALSGSEINWAIEQIPSLEPPSERQRPAAPVRIRRCALAAAARDQLSEERV
jgi:hypothetical protein